MQNKKVLNSIFILSFIPIVVTNSNSTSVNTKVTNEVSGDNASVKTEITNQVNDQSIKVQSTSPGKIEVKTNNDEVEINSQPKNIVVTVKPYKIKPTLKISPQPQPTTTLSYEKKVLTEVENQITIISFFKKIVYNIRKLIKF